jgi:hypothetical protein
MRAGTSKSIAPDVDGVYGRWDRRYGIVESADVGRVLTGDRKTATTATSAPDITGDAGWSR